MSAHSIYKCLLSCVALYGAGIFLPEASANVCTVTIPTTLPAKQFVLSKCEFAGNLKKTGPHYMGRFVLDLKKLSSGLADFDKHMHEYFANHRYATLSLVPFDSGDESFKALLKLNGVSQFIHSKVFFDKYKMESNFNIDLRDFNFKAGYGWDLINPVISIKAEIGHAGKNTRILGQP